MERELNLEERLAAELGWLQKLARSLIRDPGVADDVVQDVLLDRLRTPHGAGPAATLRRDLFGRLKTRAFNKRREAARRRLREQRYAQEASEAGSLASSKDDASLIMGEADTAELLMKEVMALNDAHRAILLLCYFEGRPQRGIAATLGISEEAVRTRLTRARAALRKRLDVSSGRGDKGWLPAVSALAERSSVTRVSLGSPWWTWVLGLSGMKWMVGAALAVLVAVLSLTFGSGDSIAPGSVELGAGSSGPRAEPGDELADLAVVEDVSARTVVPVGTPPRSGSPVVAPPSHGQEQTIAGRVVEEVDGGEHAPLEGALVRVLSYEALEGLARDPSFPVITARTDERGAFKVAMPSINHGVLEITYPGKVRTFEKIEGFWPDHEPVEPRWLESILENDIVLIDGQMMAGHAVDSGGAPIAGVSIQAFWPAGYALDSFDDSSWGAMVPPLGTTGPDGRFEIRHRPGPDGALLFQHPGYITKLAGPPLGEEPLRVTLTQGASISGRVDRSSQDSSGDDEAQKPPEPIVVVAVPFGQPVDQERSMANTAQPDEDGRFSLGGLVPGQSYQVQVFSGARHTIRSEPRSLRVVAVAGTTDLPLPIRAPIEVSFRVVDEGGAPVRSDTRDQLSVGAFFAIRGTNEWSYFSDGLHRTPLFEEHWPEGKVHLMRLVPSQADERLCIDLNAIGKETLRRWCGPFSAGERVDLGTIVMGPRKPKAKPIRSLASVEVVVVNRTGQPVASASVEHLSNTMEVDLSQSAPLRLTPLQVADCRSRGRASTGDNGVATFAQLSSGAHLFRCASPTGWIAESVHDYTGDRPRGVGEGWATVAVSGNDTSAKSVVVEQPPLCVVRGRVSMEDQDIAGAAVCFAARHDPRAIKAARSRARRMRRDGAILLDASGKFTSKDVPTAEWMAIVALPGHQATFEFSVSTRAPVVDLNLVLEHTTASGIVLDPEGSPVTGALVGFWDGSYGLANRLYDTSGDMSSEGLGSVRHPRLRSNGGVLTGADGTYSIPVTSAQPGWALVIEHDDYAARVVHGAGSGVTGEITMPQCELMPCGEVQLLAAGRTDIWYVVLERVADDLEPAAAEWSTMHYGNREGYTFFRVPVGKVQVRAIMDRELGIPVGVVDVRAGERTFIEIDPDAAPVKVSDR